MNRRVLVTRAAEGASSLALQLRQRGLEPVVIPVIEIAPPEDLTALDGALAALNTFDWLVFSSANGVAAFAARRRELALDQSLWPATLQVAAIGQATARAAEACGLAVNLRPPQAVAESFADALAPFARQPAGRPARMLLLRAAEGRDVLPERLRAAGAEVHMVTAYRNVLPEGSRALLRTVFAPAVPPPAAVTFTSASTVRNLLALCAAAGVCLPAETLRISIGPITSEALRQEGLPPHAEAPEATVESLAETVSQVLQTRDEERRRRRP